MADNSKTPKIHRAFIPQGHVLVNAKWHGSELVKAIQEHHTRVLFDDTLGQADFLSSSEVAMVYVTEADLISGADYRTKVLKVSKGYQRLLVMAEKTPISDQYFPGLQKFVVMERSLALIPLTSTTEAAKSIAQMVKLESKPQNNPYRIKRKPQSADTALLMTIQAIPGLGEKKAMDLLKEYKSVEGISKANVEVRET